MKKIIFIIFVWLTAFSFDKLQAQILTVSPGTDMTIKSGTVFSADSLILTPSADFTLSNLSLNKNPTVIHSLPKPYIGRVYQFTRTTNPFSGTVQINYRDAELKGINENDLALNIYNGTAWNAYTATSRNTASNFVLTSGLNAVPFNELTLGIYKEPPVITQVSVTRNSKVDYADHLFESKVMPNPSSQYFELQVNTGSNEKIDVNLYDISGRFLSRMNAVNNQALRFGSNLRPGTYMVEVIQGQQKKMIKVIKQ